MPDRDTQLQMIHQVILDRWATPKKLNQDLARSFSLSVQEVEDTRNSPEFQAEYEKQLGIYKADLDDVQLADLKERLKALDRLYHTIDDQRVALKIKVLEQIRRETGPDLTVDHRHAHGHLHGFVNTPPQAKNLAEWLQGNVDMYRAAGEEEKVREEEAALERLMKNST